MTNGTEGAKPICNRYLLRSKNHLGNIDKGNRNSHNTAMFSCVVLEPEANNTHSGMTFFFAVAVWPPDMGRVSNHYHCPVSLLYWILKG